MYIPNQSPTDILRSLLYNLIMIANYQNNDRFFLANFNFQAQ